MGNACLGSWALNHCLNSPRTSSQFEDEDNLYRVMSSPAVIPASEKQTGTVSNSSSERSNNRHSSGHIFTRSWRYRVGIVTLISRNMLAFFRESWHEAFSLCRTAKSLPYVKFLFPTA